MGKIFCGLTILRPVYSGYSGLELCYDTGWLTVPNAIDWQEPQCITEWFMSYCMFEIFKKVIFSKIYVHWNATRFIFGSKYTRRHGKSWRGKSSEFCEP